MRSRQGPQTYLEHHSIQSDRVTGDKVWGSILEKLIGVEDSENMSETNRDTNSNHISLEDLEKLSKVKGNITWTSKGEDSSNWNINLRVYLDSFSFCFLYVESVEALDSRI